MRGLESAERFWMKFQRNPDSGCWEWTAGKNSTGYGQFYFHLRLERAHRVAYTLLVGPIPEGLAIDHLCRNRGCVNPSHLEPVTNRENLLRGDTLPAANVRKTHCPQGHAYDEANTYITKRGLRMCKACSRERDKRRNRPGIGAR